jgi:hypothetical protein
MNQYQDNNGLWHDRDIKRYGLSNNWQNYTARTLRSSDTQTRLGLHIVQIVF